MCYISLRKLEPSFSLRVLTLAGNSYQVPIKIYKNRQMVLACNWILHLSRERSVRNFGKEVGKLFMETFQDEGLAFQKKEDWHKIGLVNRGYIRFLK